MFLKKTLSLSNEMVCFYFSVVFMFIPKWLHYGICSEGDSGQYTILTGKLNTEKQYRLKIENVRVDIVSPFVTRFAPKAMPALIIDTSDVTGDLKITVEGITIDGETVYITAFFVVMK